MWDVRVLPVSIMCSSFGLVRAFLALMIGIVWERAWRWPSCADDVILVANRDEVTSRQTQCTDVLSNQNI